MNTALTRHSVWSLAGAIGLLTAVPMLLLGLVLWSRYTDVIAHVIADASRNLQGSAPPAREAWTDLVAQTAARQQAVEEMGLYVFAMLCGVIIFNSVIMACSLLDRLLRAEREQRRAHAKLEESNKMAALGRLAAGVAHEINNPVAIMLQEAGWAAELVEEEPFGATEPGREVLHAMEQIARQGGRCRDITSGLLKFARKDPRTMVPLSLAELATEALAMTRERAARAHVTLRAELDGDLPLVNGSPNRLQQVLYNLFNNALDAMAEQEAPSDAPSDSPRGEIVIRGHLQDGDVVLEISDTGPGIPPSRLRQIFDPFYTTKPPGKGTGLGLAICHGIVAEHGGRIGVRSGAGQGTTFILRFPPARRQLSPASGAQAVFSTASEKAAAPHGSTT